LKNKKLLILISCLLFVPLFTLPVLANSSWHWLTIHPIDLLPYAIIITLAVETFAIYKFGVSKRGEGAIAITFIAVCIANLMSFIIPPLLITCGSYFTGSIRVGRSFSEMWNYMAKSGPTFIIGIGYLLTTLIIEMPIVFLILKRFTNYKGQLITVIILTNVITTAMVAITERIACKGAW